MRDGLQGLYPPSLVTGSVKSRSYECNPQMISPRDMYPLFTRVRGKKNSQKFASRILHRSPSESREDGFWGHSRGVRGIYILRSCIEYGFLIVSKEMTLPRVEGYPATPCSLGRKLQCGEE
jgi:hypothetical protein